MIENRFLLDYLNANGNSVKEYQLLSYIKKEHAHFFSPLGDQPSLFKQHFFLFHQLHRLAEKLLDEGLALNISALEISCYKIDGFSTDVGQRDPLREFYLDSDNLELSDEDIRLMMKQFWEKYLAIDKKAEAIKVLCLQHEADLSADCLKRQFNRLAKQHHPDKGGCQTEFIKIKAAYDTLKVLL
jgi:hypothetical protein